MNHNHLSSTSTRTSLRPRAGWGRSAPVAGLGLALLLTGCAGEEPPSIEQGELPLGSVNGLSINGLSINGLSINGLSINGLSINGLGTASFSTWFNQNLTYAPTVMSYIVKCAMPSGAELAWQNPATGASYTWQGNLGLAPGWTAGQPATLPEQQVVSACLAAHANKYGLHVAVAVEGRDARGTQVPIASGELATYGVKEGCFFGNLFSGDGIFVGTETTSLLANHSSPRACAMEDLLSSKRQDCPPMVNVGQCRDFCVADPSGVFYTECHYGGKSYLPLATRIQPQDLYTCGDGVCQFTESCGLGITTASCLLDCGLCPSKQPPLLKALL